ncbi:MAG TPA: Rab family GTPase [Candidatus Bathyarchaeia archaeon]|nr:Rab family GTPase [Candidatus Bathyarchaeia archaeon]
MDDKKSSDFLWKIVLCGDSFVGKTTIRKRAMGEHFAEEYISTVGADFSSYKLKFGDLTIGFQVWDLAGQDKYKYIRSSFYGGATGCFLVFDTTNPTTMKNLSTWVDEAIRYSNGTIEIFVICANKVDLKNQREISRETGLKYTQALRESSGLQCEYIETSALTGENIDIAFDKMARCLLEREGVSPIKSKEVSVTEETIELITHDEKIQKTSELETMEKAVEQPISKIIDTIPSTRKSIIAEEDAEEETEKLIAEVMAVLDETDEIIIGRKTTKDGEKAITVSRDSIESILPKKEKEPKISNELERVLKQINMKLDSLTERLKDLEEEISYTKDSNIFSSEVVEDESIEKELIEDETIDEISPENLRDELDLLSQLPPPINAIEEKVETDESLEDEFEEDKIEEQEIQEETDDSYLTLPTIEDTKPWSVKEDAFDEDQKVLESLLETAPFESKIDYKNELSSSKETEEEVVETERKSSTTIQGLQEIPDNGFVEIPNQEPLLNIEDEEYDEDTEVIGTELSSAMISELKDMSEEADEAEIPTLAPLLQLDTQEKKNLCPICGEEMKYIRQYQKYYCVKCGRYLI